MIFDQTCPFEEGITRRVVVGGHESQQVDVVDRFTKSISTQSSVKGIDRVTAIDWLHGFLINLVALR